MSESSDSFLKFSKCYQETVAKIRSGYDFPFRRGAFIECTWNKFDINHNLSALLATKEPYFAYKKIVFAAFCAWLIAPANDQLRRSSIASAMTKALMDLEDDIIEQDNETRFLLETTTRISQIGPDFFEEIYYPLGGLGAILNCPSPAEMRKLLNQEADNVDRIFFILQVLHYAATDLQNGVLRRSASKNMVIKAVDRLADKKEVPRGLRGRTAGPLWSEYEPSALLLYAAYHVKIRSRPRLKNKNFPEAILSREISFDHDVYAVPEIVSRAAYLRSTLSKGIAQETMRILKQFQMPKIPLIETTRDNFRYKNTSIIESLVKECIISKTDDQ